MFWDGAVYTFYTLWHVVYGPTQVAILEMLDKRIDQNYLTLLFKSANPSHVSMAIRSIEKHSKYHLGFYAQIISFIKSNNASLSTLALDYFQPDRLEPVIVQKNSNSI